jgi:hypothetical protein
MRARSSTKHMHRVIALPPEPSQSYATQREKAEPLTSTRRFYSRTVSNKRIDNSLF